MFPFNFLIAHTRKTDNKQFKAMELNELDNKMMPLFLAKEGGLSSWQKDEAKHDASPIINENKKSTGYGFAYHTNKGVTWRAFKEYNNSRNRKTDANEFLQMPNNIWSDIVLNRFKSQAKPYTKDNFAQWLMTYSIWGGWSRSLITKLKQGFNTIDEAILKNGYDSLFNAWKSWQLNYYNNLATTYPLVHGQSLKGWLRALNEFEDKVKKIM